MRAAWGAAFYGCPSARVAGTVRKGPLASASPRLFFSGEGQLALKVVQAQDSSSRPDPESTVKSSAGARQTE